MASEDDLLARQRKIEARMACARTLAEALRDGQVQCGGMVLMEAIGGGLAWGAPLARFRPRQPRPDQARRHGRRGDGAVE